MAKDLELDLVAIKNEINTKLGDKETMEALVLTTFKGLTPQLMKRALLEGMMRQFTFKDFLVKNVYAIPFNVKDGNQWIPSYTLITSIDYARKIGQKTGVIGKSAPEFVDKDDKPYTCSITIKKLVEGHIGEFTATVYFDEYDTKKQQWASRPRTMIAKVAEMHALRMACPEELSHLYVEEESEKERVIQLEPDEAPEVDPWREKLEKVKTEDELKALWKEMPPNIKKVLKERQSEIKAMIASETPPPAEEAKEETPA